MKNINKAIQIFWALFKGREDVHGSYRSSDEETKGFQVKKAITKREIEMHLFGQVPLGVYPLLNDNTTNWICVDFDDPDFNPILDFYTRCKHYGIIPAIEVSKNKGYHAWIFFPSPIQARKARLVVHYILKEVELSKVEIFPKQDELSDGAPYGNFVNLPLFAPLVKEGKTVFINMDDEEYKPYLDQFTFLKTINKVTEQRIDEIIATNNLKDVEPLPQSKESSQTPSPMTGRICIQRILNGVESGERNEAACRLVDHFKEESLPQDMTLAVLRRWNQSNQPPLGDKELEDTVQSIYKGNYNYGCNDGVLKKYCDQACPFLKKEKPNRKSATSDNKVQISFRELQDGSLIELAHDPERKPSVYLVMYKDGNITYHDEIKVGSEILIPSNGKIIQANAIKLPSKPEEYESDQALLKEIETFIHKYLAVDQFYEKLICYYVLLNWIFDRFNELPYLRALGDYGTGKSRFLKTVGSICYKSISCSGAATTSPIFRMIEKFKGTLIIDEGDFQDSDEHNRLTKILNQGYEKGSPVIINVPEGNSYEPYPYDVYCPKIIATRNEFKDKALESRCLTEIMDGKHREDVPVNLPDSFEEEALSLRNKLLMWRFKNWGKKQPDLSFANDSSIEPRLRQVATAILSVISDPQVKENLKQFIKKFDRELKQQRRETIEAEIVQIICEHLAHEDILQLQRVTMKEIADDINDSRDENEKKVNPRYIGYVVGERLKLSKSTSRRGISVDFSRENIEKIHRLKRKFGLEESEDRSESGSEINRSNTKPDNSIDTAA